MLGSASSAAIFPRKPRLVSELNAWVRADPRRICRENPPRCVVVLYRDSTRSALWKFAEFAFPKPITRTTLWREADLEARVLPRPLCEAHVHAADGFGHLC